MSHAYLVEIDHSVVGMIVLEADGYRFYATKPALSSLHSHLFDTAHQAHYAILDRNGRSTDTKSSLTPLCKAESGSGDVPESNATEMAHLQSSEHIPDALLSHYQGIGISAVVAALNVIAESGQSGSPLEGNQAHIEIPEFLRSDQVAA
jgi:hypothetical protein